MSHRYALIDAPRRSIRRGAWTFRTEQFELLALLTPYTVGLLGLLLLPLLLTAPLAFSDFDGIAAPRWSGLNNFRRLAGDPIFGESLLTTLQLVALAAPMRGLVALGLALVLESRRCSRGILRNSAFLPTVMPDVAYALLWLYLFSPLWGPLNWLLPLIGQRPDAWLLQPLPARLAVVIALSWTVGEGIVLLLAARRSIPSELYEAARLDGAGARALLQHITLPLLLPFQALLLCRDVVVVLGSSLVMAQVLTQGGPRYATTYLPLYIYFLSSDGGQWGYAAALNLILFGLTLGLLGCALLLSRRWWPAAE